MNTWAVVWVVFSVPWIVLVLAWTQLAWRYQRQPKAIRPLAVAEIVLFGLGLLEAIFFDLDWSNLILGVACIFGVIDGVMTYRANKRSRWWRRSRPSAT